MAEDGLGVDWSKIFQNHQPSIRPRQPIKTNLAVALLLLGFLSGSPSRQSSSVSARPRSRGILRHPSKEITLFGCRSPARKGLCVDDEGRQVLIWTDSECFKALARSGNLAWGKFSSKKHELSKCRLARWAAKTRRGMLFNILSPLVQQHNV